MMKNYIEMYEECQNVGNIKECKKIISDMIYGVCSRYPHMTKKARKEYRDKICNTFSIDMHINDILVSIIDEITMDEFEKSINKKVRVR